MFMGLKQPLSRARRVKGTLVFEKAGTVAIEFTVQARRRARGGRPQAPLGRLPSLRCHMAVDY